jgi:peptidoglycan hydrolase-like protein with peptidoglycan-binding domain
MSEEDLAAVNLETILGVQQALAKLGIDPGKQDGYDGPHTQNAVRQFQSAAGVAADGIVGPVTRAKLADALRGLEHRTDDQATATGADGGTGDAPQS